ncbi:MAG: hypothetical protein ACERKZ_10260 [Lachnotalea sp.]
MKDLCKLLGDCIDLLDEIYDYAMNENINKIRTLYSVLSNAINEVYITILSNGNEITPLIIKQMEEMYDAYGIGDCIRVLDIAGFEMKPILQQYLESIGE